METDLHDDGTELRALQELVQSDGWKILRTHADHDWGPTGYGQRMQEALASVKPGPERDYEIARIAQQVDDTARAVNLLMAYPAQRIGLLVGPKKSGQPFAPWRRVTR